MEHLVRKEMARLTAIRVALESLKSFWILEYYPKLIFKDLEEESLDDVLDQLPSKDRVLAKKQYEKIWENTHDLITDLVSILS